jgi:glycine/D-amino acid oxidase-like deaminating enzyme
VVGGGLAGCALAKAVRRHGASVLVIDRGGASASRVAAGLVTPITGKRLTVAPRWDAFYRAARELYSDLVGSDEQPLWRESTAVRVLATDEDCAQYERRRAAEEFSAHLAALDPPLDCDCIDARRGAFAMRSARLDVAGFVDATRDTLRATGDWIDGSIDPGNDVLSAPAGPLRLPRLGVSATRVVWCVGYSLALPTWLAAVAARPAKGELLTIVAPDLREPRSLHRGVWIAPARHGGEHHYDVGATHEWNTIDSAPTAAARDGLIAALRDFLRCTFEVVDHRAGVRPALVDRRPIVGWRPDDPREGVLGGLGGKGVLWAPLLAEQLARSARHGERIDDEFDVALRLAGG